MRRLLAMVLVVLAAPALGESGGQPLRGSRKPVPACSDGAVSAQCKCGSAKVSSGFCCAGAVQTWACRLIDPTPETVCHVRWNGTALVQSSCGGLTWAAAGSPTQVAGSGRTPPGASGWAIGTYYSLGTGSDVLDFTGDFTSISVFTPAANNNGVLISPGSGFAGWAAQVQSTPNARITAFRAGGTENVVTLNAYVNGAPNVLCAGRTGTSLAIKLNEGAYRTTVAGEITPATSQSSHIGRLQSGANPFNGVIHELWFSTATPSDAACSALIATAKARLGVTW